MCLAGLAALDMSCQALGLECSVAVGARFEDCFVPYFEYHIVVFQKCHGWIFIFLALDTWLLLI